MTSYIFLLLILVPLLCLGIMMVLPRRWEPGIFAIALVGVAVDFLLYCGLLYQWVRDGFMPIAVRTGSLYHSATYTFSFDWYFDTISAVYFGLTCIITMLIFLFSRYYMHREPGYFRYFRAMMFFFIGLTLIIVSGNLEVLFLGWEWIGISSFLLIAYYRDRFLPVRNALKVFSLYRIADAAMIIAIWVGHHVLRENAGFSQLAHIAEAHESGLLVLGFLFLIVAIIKSAQFPFSYWLSRAMEGPTTSSAIFYGALSVHMGLFVLLRTYPLWEWNVMLRIVVAASGIVTAMIATAITRVQSSIKSQIAYASITQIGIMFVEVAAGMHILALVHMVSNAFLRTYQLLISPSIVGYLVHDQFFYFTLPRKTIPHTIIGTLRATLFVLSIKEWDMNAVITRYVWKPLKDIGRTVSFLDTSPVGIRSFVIVLIALSIVGLQTGVIVHSLFAPIIAVFVSILFFIRAYSTKHTPMTAWNLIMLGYLCIMLFFAFVIESTWYDMLLYASGIVVTFVAGHACLQRLESRGETTFLFEYHGHVYEYPRLAQVFFVVCLGHMAFPITPTFLGQDMLLSRIPVDSAMLVVLFGVAYLLSGISIMRLFAKVFFGPHKKRYHEVAHKSA